MSFSFPRIVLLFSNVSSIPSWCLLLFTKYLLSRMFWSGWRSWSRSRLVLYLDWVTPATQAVMKVTCVSPNRKSGPRGHMIWNNEEVLKEQWCWSVFCDRAQRCCTDSGSPQILRPFQGSKHFPRDQRFWLETPGWDVLDYESNVMSPAEVEQQRERLLRAPLVVRDM